MGVSDLTNSRNVDSPKSSDGSITQFNTIKLISAFMLFTEEFRPKISAAYPGEIIEDALIIEYINQHLHQLTLL